MSARTEKGFTLVEVMVVIAITGMIAVLLLEMMTIMFRGYDQVGRIQTRLAQETMQLQWFRETMGVMAASLDQEFAFKGSAGEITGYTMAPLLSEQGKLTRISWRIEEAEGESRLIYHEADHPPMNVGSLRDSELRFEYRGQLTNWLGGWPDEQVPVGSLPFRIKLAIEGASGPREVYAAINVRRLGRYDFRDLID